MHTHIHINPCVRTRNMNVCSFNDYLPCWQEKNNILLFISMTSHLFTPIFFILPFFLLTWYYAFAVQLLIYGNDFNSEVSFGIGTFIEYKWSPWPFEVIKDFMARKLFVNRKTWFSLPTRSKYTLGKTKPKPKEHHKQIPAVRAQRKVQPRKGKPCACFASGITSSLCYYTCRCQGTMPCFFLTSV